MAPHSVERSRPDDADVDLQGGCDPFTTPPGRRSTTTPDFWPPRPERPRRDETERTWHHIMPVPEPEWAAERRDQRMLLKLLPRRLRRAVQRIKNTYWRGLLLDEVVNELRRRAAEHERLHRTCAATELIEVLYAPLSYVPGPDAARLLREIAADDRFALRLRKAFKSTARLALALQHWSFNPAPILVPRVSLPRQGAVELESWCGLVSAPLPHRPPEALLVGLARLFWRGARRHVDRALHLLDWGAGNSPFVKALLVTAPKGVRCESKLLVDEVDVLGDAPSELAFVGRACAAPAHRLYDFAIAQLPPPCVGRGGYRDRYKELDAGRPGQARLRDLGRLGARRWARSAPRVIRQLLTTRVFRREVALVIPMFEVRSAATPEHQVFEAVCVELRQAVQDAGLVIERDFAVASTEVDTEWRCIVATRRPRRLHEGCLPEFDDDVELSTLEEVP